MWVSVSARHWAVKLDSQVGRTTVGEATTSGVVGSGARASRIFFSPSAAASVASDEPAGVSSSAICAPSKLETRSHTQLYEKYSERLRRLQEQK